MDKIEIPMTVVEPSQPSPRARDVAAYWDATGKCTSCGAQGNGMQACGTCFGLGGQLGTFNAREELVTAKAALELLKKEVEDLRAMKKLRGEPDAPKYKTLDGEIVGRVLDERNALRRELENLKRGFKMEHADLRARYEATVVEKCETDVKVAFLQQELDRERAKNKRRGI